MQQHKDVLLTAMSDILLVVFVSEVFHRVNRWYFKDSRNSMITGGMLLIVKNYFNLSWCTVLNQMLYLFLRKRLISLNRVSNVNYVFFFLTIKLVFIRFILFLLDLHWCRAWICKVLLLNVGKYLQGH